MSTTSLQFFAIPAIDSQAAQAELNAFMAAHRVVAVDRQWLAAGLQLALGCLRDRGSRPRAAARRTQGGAGGQGWRGLFAGDGRAQWANAMKRQAIALLDIADHSNLALAFHQAARAKHHRPALQHFANAYLDCADRWLQTDARVAAQVRYMDDIVWWCHSRAEAQQSLADFAAMLLAQRGLRLKPSARIARSDDGLLFCGYRVRQSAILPSRRKLTRYRCAMARIEAVCAAANPASVTDADLQRAADSTHAALAHCQSLGFRQQFWRTHPSVYDAQASQG